MTTSLPTYTGDSTSLVQPTGIPLVDAVIVGTKWGTGPAGTGATLTYSFPDGFDDFDTRSGIAGNYNAQEPTQNGNSQFLPGYTPFGVAQVDATRAMFQTWASVANLQFNEVAPTGIDAGVLRFAFTAPPGFGATTYASSAFPQDLPLAGDTWFNSAFAFPDGWAPGTQNYLTLLHEVGHALGLKHPHDPGDTTLTAGWTVAPVVLPFTGSDTLTTYSTQDMVMAYNDKPGVGAPIQADFAPTTPMRVDIAAMQYLYGANQAFNVSATTYTYNSSALYNETIWDAGGIDTIRVEGNSAAMINLTPGSWSQLGRPLTYSERDTTTLAVTVAHPELTDPWTVYIYDTVVIENAIGGGGNDRIQGNEADNLISGGEGDDSIDGGAGIDTILFSGPRSAYTVVAMTNGFAFSSLEEGMDTVTGGEIAQFADQMVAFGNLIDIPTALSFSPADAATGIAIGSNITVTFNEPIQSGSGTIVLKTTAGAVIASYPSTSPNLAFSGSTLTLNPTANLQPFTSYKVEIAAGSIQDLAGNPYAGTTSYDFTTGPRLTVGDALVSVYTGMYNRAPDQGGLSFWQQDVQNKFGLQSDSAVTDLAFQRAMVQAFAQFPTYYVLYKDMTDTAFVSQLYVNLQNRTADSGGLGYWVGRINGSIEGADGPDSREKVTADFIYGTLSADYGSDAFVNNFDAPTLAAAQAAQDAARNKIEVAKYYTQVFGALSDYGDIVGSGYFNPNPASPTYEADARALQAWLQTQAPYANSTDSIAGVTSDSATVASSKALVDDLYDAASSGGQQIAVSLVGVVEG